MQSLAAAGYVHMRSLRNGERYDAVSGKAGKLSAIVHSGEMRLGWPKKLKIARGAQAEAARTSIDNVAGGLFQLMHDAAALDTRLDEDLGAWMGSRRSRPFGCHEPFPYEADDGPKLAGLYDLPERNCRKADRTRRVEPAGRPWKWDCSFLSAPTIRSFGTSLRRPR
ncbi:hypothetical protein BX600DRAFT_438343 [Xylariales sp. PMI_506]|nr:hypothetical protein BX600DRAFT_438343 [Xylariales sp. PMI_506]